MAGRRWKLYGSVVWGSVSAISTALGSITWSDDAARWRLWLEAAGFPTMNTDFAAFLTGAGVVGLWVYVHVRWGDRIASNVRSLRHSTETILFGVGVTYWWSDYANTVRSTERKAYLRPGKSIDISIADDVPTGGLFMRFSIPVKSRVLKFDCESGRIEPDIDYDEGVGREYAISVSDLPDLRTVTVTARRGSNAPEIPSIK